MTVCVRINGKKREVCIADLDRLITLQNRAITPPAGGSVDYTMFFTDKVDAAMLNEFNGDFSGDFASTTDDPLPVGAAWAMIQSVNGESIFDGTNTERTVTHRVYIRYDSAVTAETWFTFDGFRFDILDVDDLDMRHEFQLLRCNNRGLKTRSTTAQ